MAVRLKKGATPIFNNLTKNRGLEREWRRLLTFQLSKNVLNNMNLPLDATGKSGHILRTQGKMETLLGVILLTIDQISMGTMGGLFTWRPYYFLVLLDALLKN